MAEKQFNYDRVIINCNFSDDLKTPGVYSLVYGATGNPYYDGKHYEDCLSRITRYQQVLNDKTTVAFRGHIWEFIMVLNQILNGEVRWSNEYSNRFGKNIPNYFLDYWVQNGRCYTDCRINWCKTKIMYQEMLTHGKITAVLKSTDYYSEVKFIQEDLTDTNIEHTGYDVNRNLQKQEEELARQWLFNELKKYGDIKQPTMMERYLFSHSQMWYPTPNTLPPTENIYSYD